MMAPMAVAWKIEQACLLMESTEASTLDEWKAAVDAALEAPAFRPGMPVVHDARRLFRVPTPDEARERVAFLQAKCREAKVVRWAIVVSGSAQYGMARLAGFANEAAPGGLEFRVFRDLQEAQEWARGRSMEGGHVA
jgi:hypothetical protein